MAMANEIKKNNPENIEINPENFKIPENSREKLADAEKIPLNNDKNLDNLDKEFVISKLKQNAKSGVGENIKTKTVTSFYKRRAQEIDKILADGLHETFLKLSPKKQQEFKLAGEDTTAKINLLLNKTKIKVDKIISLIKKWLKIIPGINHFFLEQEAKIKADKIINIKDKV